jgi:hypothetical protein
MTRCSYLAIALVVMTFTAPRVDAGGQGGGSCFGGGSSISGQGSNFGGGSSLLGQSSSFGGGNGLLGWRREPGSIGYWPLVNPVGPDGKPRTMAGGFVGFGFPSSRETLGSGWPGFYYLYDFMGQPIPRPNPIAPPKK